MKKKFLITFFFLFLFIFLIPFKNQAFANCKATLSSYAPTTKDTLTVTLTDTNKDHRYHVSLAPIIDGREKKPTYVEYKDSSADNETLTFSINLSEKALAAGEYYVYAGDYKDLSVCFNGGKVKIKINESYTVPPPAGNNTTCAEYKGTEPAYPLASQNVVLKFSPNSTNYFAIIVDRNENNIFILKKNSDSLDVGQYSEDTKHEFTISPINPPAEKPTSPPCGGGTFLISKKEDVPPQIAPTFAHPTPPCAPDGLEIIGEKDGKIQYKCKFINTALGNIPTSFEGFVSALFGILLSVSGGVALILIIISGYRIMASQGNPEKLKEAKESLTSAIIGLLFIIFSSFILKVIGVDILQIPSFIP